MKNQLMWENILNLKKLKKIKIMKKIKKLSPHLTAILIFVSISAIYFSPVFEGKVLNMPDIIQYKGMSEEATQYRINNDGEQTQWTGSSFSGMPTYQIGLQPKGNLIQYVDKALQLGLPRPLDYFFLYLIGFYILLLTLKIDYKLAIVGAIGFAFSSYFIIIIQAGHMTKAHAIAYLPLIVASVLYTFKSEKWLLGAAFTSLCVGLQLFCNHYQITYYTVILLLFIGIVQFLKELQRKTLPNFFKRAGILVVAALLAGATNATRLATTIEYSPETQRGKSELKNDQGEWKDNGLDNSYILEYSYGKAETMTFLIPNFKGGSMGRSILINSEGELNEQSAIFKTERTRKELRKWSQAQSYKEDEKAYNKAKEDWTNFLFNTCSFYWGDNDRANQRVGPGAPTYLGAVIILLFVLGLLLVRSSYIYWILPSTILSILLAWGYNLYGFSEFFIDFIPGYGKFRAVTMIMVLAEFGIVLLAILAVNKFLNKGDTKYKEQKLKLAFYITGGITLLFTIAPSLFLDFGVSISDNPFLNALKDDRESILKSDAWRSFIYIFISVGSLWMFNKNRIKKDYVVIILGILIVSDLWSVDKRYLNDTHFVKERKFSVGMSLADQYVIRNNSNGSRVLDYSVRAPFSSARASFFHNSIGGYSAVKLKRYQELYEEHISPKKDTILNGRRFTVALPSPNKDKILGMLNCGWIITPSQAFSAEEAGLSPLGNAWFVSDVNFVKNANQELDALANFNLQKASVVDERFQNMITQFIKNDSASIILDHRSYKPNHLIYSLANITSDHLAIFSEIYYEKGWNAYIDGNIIPHFRANYVLRGMIVPKGTTKIEFKFEPSTYKKAESVSLASSLILLFLLAFVSFKELRRI